MKGNLSMIANMHSTWWRAYVEQVLRIRTFCWVITIRSVMLWIYHWAYIVPCDESCNGCTSKLADGHRHKHIFWLSIVYIKCRKNQDEHLISNMFGCSIMQLTTNIENKGVLSSKTIFFFSFMDANWMIGHP